MENNLEYDLSKERYYQIAKANDLVRQAKADLNLTELKIMSFLFSKIRPDDTELKEYEFDTKSFCQICGLDYKNGYHYENIKKTIDNLFGKKFWIIRPNGDEVGCQWIVKPVISKRSGKIIVKLDSDMQQYVIGLKERYTQYEFINILPMQSSYSIRIYEILMSYRKIHSVTFEIEDLKNKLMCQHYKSFADVRRRVLEPAIEEINKYANDIYVSYEPIKHGAKVIKVKFHIRDKEIPEQLSAIAQTTGQLEGSRKKSQGEEQQRSE